MRKRGRIFSEVLIISLAAVLVSATMAYCTYLCIFEMDLSERICFEQEDNQEFRDRAGGGLSFTSIELESGPIRNPIRVNARASCSSTHIFTTHSKSITAQTLFRSPPRASPP